MRIRRRSDYLVRTEEADKRKAAPRFSQFAYHVSNTRNRWLVTEMGRVCVEISDELEKKLRFKAIEQFGGRKGDLSRAVEEAVKTWVAKEE